MADRTWPSVPAPLAARFTRAVAGLRDVTTRRMFGCPAAFTAGHMFAGLFADSMFLRLPAAERDRFIRAFGAAPFEPVRGRVMREYVVVPPEVLAAPRTLAGALAKAHAYASSLPPKAPRAARAP